MNQTSIERLVEELKQLIDWLDCPPGQKQELSEKLTSALSQARQEGREEFRSEIEHKLLAHRHIVDTYDTTGAIANYPKDWHAGAIQAFEDLLALNTEGE